MILAAHTLPSMNELVMVATHITVPQQICRYTLGNESLLMAITNNVATISATPVTVKVKVKHFHMSVIFVCSVLGSIKASSKISTNLDNLYTVWKPLAHRFQKCKIWFKFLMLGHFMWSDAMSIGIFWGHCSVRTKTQEKNETAQNTSSPIVLSIY